MSVIVGMCRLCPICLKMFKPFSSPIPLNDDSFERLALRYEALKISLMSSLEHISTSLSAISKGMVSFSITHGPAMRKKLSLLFLSWSNKSIYTNITLVLFCKDSTYVAEKSYFCSLKHKKSQQCSMVAR